ncbi:DUF4326 domain-containing protein [Sulfurimonas sp. CS5]|jgi:hypothetical protein|uniref:DUF4326 domain-containing protein n=1 Tax=Sulfurimonas sp. CS5 TaxID=3391145 RepID=UPI0039EAB87B
MNNILILYPKEFKSKDKFERKVSRITKNINDYTISYLDDYNDFITSYFIQVKTEKITSNEIDTITHVIIFDDGEEFKKETSFFKSKNIPLRLIKILITRVINIKTNTQYDKDNSEYEYIGRGSYWGNPHSMFENGDTREEVIRKFKYDFDKDMFINKKKDEVRKLVGKRLGCFCKPSSCHGDILADFLNSQDDGK